jgi:hypothetical protein
VDGWRVAAVIAGEKLAAWAVEALDEAARAAIAARVGGNESGKGRPTRIVVFCAMPPTQGT